MRGRSIERDPSGSQHHGRSKSRSKKNVKCYHCGKKGHVKKECWQLTKKKMNDLETSKAQGCVASNSNDGEIMFSEATTISKDRRQLTNNWLMGS